METWLVTGGAGFLGRAVVARLLEEGRVRVVVLDALTYAAHPDALRALGVEPIAGDVAEPETVAAVFENERPAVVLHLAAESHVDRALHDAAPFVRTNVTGCWVVAKEAAKRGARLVQVSTDEVYGDREGLPASRPGDPETPTNPYAAAKACGDAIVRSLVRSDGLDAVITRGCNTYGPGQFPEKLLPLAARRWAAAERMPLYGDGFQVREWIHVDDHAAGIVAAARSPRTGVLHLGSGDPRTNREVLMLWASALGLPGPSSRWLRQVPDRPGHDRRYHLEVAGSWEALGWRPARPLEQGLFETARWTEAHPGFWDVALAREDVRAFFERQYPEPAEALAGLATVEVEVQPRPQTESLGALATMELDPVGALGEEPTRVDGGSEGSTGDDRG